MLESFAGCGVGVGVQVVRQTIARHTRVKYDGTVIDGEYIIWWMINLIILNCLNSL